MMIKRENTVGTKLGLLLGILVLAACNSNSDQIAAPTLGPAAPPIITPTKTSQPTVVLSKPIQPLVYTQTPAPMQISSKLSYFRMFSEESGWGIGDKRSILRTDGGINDWRHVSPPLYWHSEPYAYFFDSESAIIFDYSIDIVTNKPRFWITHDGGSAWEGPYLLPRFSVGGSVGSFSLYFLNSSQGWLYGRISTGASNVVEILFETRDGGETWEWIYNSYDDQQPKGRARIGGSVTFLTPQFGYGRHTVTQDGGRTWKNINLPQPPDYPALESPNEFALPMQFVSDKTGAFILRVYEEDQVPALAGIHGLPQGEFIYYTQNGGISWSPQVSPARLGKVYFLDELTGWYLGVNGETGKEQTMLYKTRDGGKSWEILSRDSALPLGVTIHFVDQNFGYAIKSYSDYYLQFDHRVIQKGGGFFVTYDGGHTWEEFSPHVVP